MQALQQQRARYALNQVTQALGAPIDHKALKSHASGFPAMIQANGLGQAAAFYFSQGGVHRRLYEMLSGWLTQANQPYAGKDLLAGVTEEDMHRYRVAQVEALLFLDWVKKFTKAYVREA